MSARKTGGALARPREAVESAIARALGARCLSTTEIAEEFGCATSTVLAVRRRIGADLVVYRRRGRGSRG